MSFTLYKNSMRGSWKLLVILAAVLAMYISIIATMFDPTLGAVLDEFARVMPELMAIVGMTEAGASLVDFMASYLYGFVMLVFPMVYTMLAANRLVAAKVDRGTMAYLLATPLTRVRVAFTQLAALASGIVLLVGFATGVGFVSCQICFPGELDTGRFLLINLGTLALQLFIGGICFLASCVFNDTKYSIGLGAGIPALAFVVQMMANAGDALENAKYATFFTLFSPKALLAGEGWAVGGIVALAVGAAVLYALAVAIFRQKDLPV